MPKKDIVLVTETYRDFTYDVIDGGLYPGIRWRIHQPSLDGRVRYYECGGAFYNGEPDHPEGAVAWAEFAVRRYIDGLHKFLEDLQ